MSMKNRLRDVGIALVIFLISIPLAIFVTIMLLPLWRWLESTFKIESIGHSGPAEWCYWTSYFVIVSCFSLLWWNSRRRGKR